MTCSPRSMSPDAKILLDLQEQLMELKMKEYEVRMEIKRLEEEQREVESNLPLELL